MVIKKQGFKNFYFYVLPLYEFLQQCGSNNIIFHCYYKTHFDK